MDDVAFLQENSEEASYLFVVDSADRDTAVYKTPSQYQVNFQNPFRNVFSLQVLDVSIPRSEYIVSASSNTLVYQMQGDQVKTLVLTPGDYQVDRLMGDLNGLLAEQADHTTGNYLTVQALTSPPDLSSKLKFTCAVPFTLYASQSSMRGVLGFSNPIRAEDAGTFYAAPAGYRDGDPDVLLSLPGPVDDPLVTNTFLGPDPVVETVAVTATQQPRQMFYATQSGVLSRVQAAFGVLGSGPPAGDVRIQWLVTDAGAGATVASGSLAVEVDEVNSYSSTIEGDIQVAADLVMGAAYYITFWDPLNGDPANCYALFHSYQVLPTKEAGILDTFTLGGARFGDGTQQLCVQLDVAQAQQQIISPGLYDLVGERYVMLRCQEIEDFLYKERAYEKYNAGLALVKLGNYGYQNQQFNYSGFPPRTFHPIGKLSKLTLRFEKRGGVLYDFQGVDHVITFLVRYYATKAKQPTARESAAAANPLNPHYTPYINEYQYTRMLHDSESEESDC